MHLYGVVF